MATSIKNTYKHILAIGAVISRYAHHLDPIVVLRPLPYSVGKKYIMASIKYPGKHSIFFIIIKKPSKYQRVEGLLD